jgi:hypothetical protein
VWVSSEIVVEGDIFLKNYDDVLDGRRRYGIIGVAMRPEAAWSRNCQAEGREKTCKHTKTLRVHGIS